MTTSRAKRSIRWLLPSAIVAGALLVTAAPAVACGGLVGVNGTIKLTRTTTLAAYHDGVERYVTAFDFSGSGKEVGSIVPLPGVPSKVERGGNWTLQRLEREVAPPERFAAEADGRDDAGSSAPRCCSRRRSTRSTSRSSRAAAPRSGKWATDTASCCTPDAPAMLDFYASPQPDLHGRALQRRRVPSRLGQNTGDGTPIMLTIPTTGPWVPLRILGLGLDKSRIVDADVFLLTDQPPEAARRRARA